MKSIIALTCALVMATTAAQTINCENPVCTREFFPMCGTNGVTYDNKCGLQYATECVDSSIQLAHFGFCEEGQATVKPAADSCERQCTREYAPVCGSKGSTLVTYNNRCLFEVAQCKDSSIELANNGVCYNPSLRTRDDDKDAPSSKSCNTICTRGYFPICGSNGETYSNTCHFEAAQCEDKSIIVAHIGECRDAESEKPSLDACDRQCTKEYSPVCGSKDSTLVTYNNQCQFEMAQCKDSSIRLAYTAECFTPSLRTRDDDKDDRPVWS